MRHATIKSPTPTPTLTRPNPTLQGSPGIFDDLAALAHLPLHSPHAIFRARLFLAWNRPRHLSPQNTRNPHPCNSLAPSLPPHDWSLVTAGSLAWALAASLIRNAEDQDPHPHPHTHAHSVFQDLPPSTFHLPTFPSTSLLPSLACCLFDKYLLVALLGIENCMNRRFSLTLGFP
jgi:hypothetical protein